ncbi:MAG: GNAT family N-acetyltransferase [Burkholderiales bacterium]|nr:GNAT family N-acetyltransferase [Burkholderiales bacterium]
MNLNIRPATIADARMIAELLANIDDYPHWKALGVNALEVMARDSLAHTHSERLTYVAELDGRLIGYASVYWLHPAFTMVEGYVSELFIRSDASGHGAGTALLDAIKAEARAKGCQRLTLVNLKDRESYKRGFYASRGWEEKSNTVRFALDLGAPDK